MKYKLAMKLFFGPSVLTRLIEVDYKFKDPELKVAQEAFKISLRATEKSLNEKGLTYMGLNDIANTIQF
jgi:hypothetical protein